LLPTESDTKMWAAPWQAHLMLDGARIHRLASQPGAAGTVFAASWGEGLWFSRDGGRRWANAPIGIAGSRVHCVTASPGGEVFVGSDHAILKRSTGDLRAWEVLDNLWLVPSSSSWSSPRRDAKPDDRPDAGDAGAAPLVPPAPRASVRDVAVNPSHEEWILAAVGGAGVLFSSDGGYSWDDMRPGTAPDTFRLLWHPDEPACALALAPRGLAHSEDGGWTWHSQTPPLSLVREASALPGGGWLLAGQGAREREELWRGHSGSWKLAAAFERGDASLESVLVAPEESEIGGVWLAGWSDGTLEFSLDEGRSWRPLGVLGATIQRACALALSSRDALVEQREGDEALQAQAQARTLTQRAFGFGAKKKARRDERNGSGFIKNGEIEEDFA
jgi:hypothetical protein